MDGSAVVLSNLQILGQKEYEPGSGPLSIFKDINGAPSSAAEQQAISLELTTLCWCRTLPLISEHLGKYSVSELLDRQANSNVVISLSRTSDYHGCLCDQPQGNFAGDH